MTWSEFVRQALQNGNLAPLNQEAAPEINAAARTALTLLLSGWSRDGLLSPSLDSTTATLVGGTNLYTLGTGGNFPARPILLTQAMIFDGSLGSTRLPLEIKLWDAFEGLTFPTSPGLPRYVSLNLTYPLAQVGFYPTPSTNYKVRLIGQFPWAAIDFNDDVSLPPGYDEAMMDALSVRVCENLNRAVPDWLRNRKRDGMSGIVMNMPPIDQAQNNRQAMGFRSSRVRNWDADWPT